VAVLSRRAFPQRPWLYLLLFGFGSSVVIERFALLEADEIFWLTLAAVLWLSARRGSKLAAGAAYGIALLVKTNAIFLLPVFLLTVPRPTATTAHPRLQTALTFLVGCGLVAGGG